LTVTSNDVARPDRPVTTAAGTADKIICRSSW
jgi:hypothetical protein